MNVAISLVRSRTADGSVDVELFRTLIREQQVFVPTGFGWDEPVEIRAEPLALGLLAGRLADTQSLDGMRESGRAGLLMLTETELEDMLADVPASDVPPSGSWLEAEDLEDGTLIVYPQDEEPELSVMVWLPVAAAPNVTQLVALDTGVDAASGEATLPAVDPTPCHPGFAGHGAERRYVCLGGTCGQPCEKKWRHQRGRSILVWCPCF